MRTCWLAVCIILLWCCAVINPTTQQATPALRATISQSGIAELLNIATGLMVKTLSKMSIPNQSGDISTPIGHITYDVSSIVLESISVGASNAVTSPPSTIQVSISEISVNLALNWGYRRDSWPHISDSGSATVSTSNTAIQVGVVLGMENGRPTVALSSCVVNLNDLSLTLHGGASWLYDIFKSIIESKIKSAVSSAIESELQSLTKTELAQILASLPTTVALDPKNAFLADLGLEVDLLANPTVGVQYFSLPLKGQFIDMNNNSTVPPFAQVAMPDVAPDAMVQLSVSQYMLDTLAYALYQSGKLHVTVVPSEIPSFFPLKLNTGALKMYLPSLYNAYPNQDLNLEVAVSAPVNFNIDTQGIHALANATIGFMVMGNETVNAFNLGLGLELDVQIVVTQNNTIIPTFGISSFVVSLENSNIGQFDVSTFGNILNVLITKLALPAVNKIIAQKAITIPVFDGVRLANADIVFNTGFMVIRSDLLFTAPHALYQYSRIRDTAAYMQSPVYKQRK